MLSWTHKTQILQRTVYNPLFTGQRGIEIISSLQALLEYWNLWYMWYGEHSPFAPPLSVCTVMRIRTDLRTS